MADAVLDFASLDTDSTPNTSVPVEGTDDANVFDGIDDLNTEDNSVVDKPEVGTEDKPDGRKTPAQLRSALKALREGSPEHAQAAKSLNDIVGRHEAYKTVFPTVNDARQAQASLEALGGQEGIANIQTQLAEIEEIDAMLAEGNPEVLDRIADIAGPDGLAGITPELLNRMEQSNPEAYASAVRPHLARAVIASGLPNVIQSIYDNLQLVNMEGASDAFKQSAMGKVTNLLKSVGQWLGEQNKDVNGPPTKSATAGKVLSEREAALQQREQEMFTRDIQANTNQHTNDTLGKALAPYLKQLNLPSDAKRDLAQGIYDELARLIDADKTYKSQIKGFMSSKKRDAGRIAQFMNAKVSAVADTAVKNVVTRRYRITKAQAAAKNTTTDDKSTSTKAAPTQAIKIAQKPPRETWDIKKTTQMDIVNGRAWLKNGKLVSWR